MARRTDGEVGTVGNGIDDGATVGGTGDESSTIDVGGVGGGSGTVNNDGSGTIENPIDTGAAVGGSDGTSRKRARKSDGSSEAPNRRRGAPKAGAKLDLNANGRRTLAQQVIGAHKIVGIVLGCPELWNLSETEAEEMTNACLDVASLYKIKPNPRVVAWINLVGVASVVYGKRVAATYVVAKMRRAQKQSNVKSAPTRSTDNDIVTNPTPAPTGGTVTPGGLVIG